MNNAGMVTKINGTAFMQFEKRVLATQMPYSMLEAMFEVDQEVQRKIDPNRRIEIREFILKSLENKQMFYFSPFIFSARNGIIAAHDGFEFEPGSKLYILDGQHRQSAISSAIGYLKSLKEGSEELGQYEKAIELQNQINMLKSYPVSMQIYLDLEQHEERQLFTDINTERKEAHIGLVMQYDYRDQYTELTRQVAESLVKEMEIEQKRSRLTNQNSAITSLSIMRKCLIALFEGILAVKSGDPYFRGCKQNEVPDISRAFFLAWKKLFPRNMSDRNKYVTGLSGIQIALAYTVFILIRQYSISHKEAIRMLASLKKHCSWKHHDPLFAHMYNPATGKIAHHSSTTAIQNTALAFIKKIKGEGND
ncbi:hypothetical protein KHA96_12010 [Bacillus sp. FJAT-49711]|uniref:DNA sulfur modification protein DndB n=1 Tax=Bacillus sp. FJAT-49711 TaxID=2833585 RepID=UPI001BC943AF|nr:DNA sulfur modification protein DndB [Bacillus sp. FJAT-49711]MBS4219041.1 hypothetical protein [Bacillus sp. FJAT-49711]